MCDLDTYCRLCAEPSPRLVGASCDLKQKMLLVNVDVSAASPLPRSVCFPCLSRLEHTAAFLAQVSAAQDKLSEIFQENKNFLEEPSDSDEDFDSGVKKEPLDLESIIKIEPCSDELPEERGPGGMEPFDTTGKTMQSQPTIQLKSIVDMIVEKNVNKSEPSETAEKDIKVIVKSDGEDTEKSYTLEQSSSTDPELAARTCHICGRVFKHKYAVTPHLKRHNTVRPHTCDTCGKSFWYKSRLQEHMSMHSSERPYSCQQCGKTFRLKTILDAHKDTHSELRKNAKRKYLCECGKAWKSKFQLEKHKKTHFERTRDYSCHICGKAYLDKGGLQGHMVIHEAKQYKCDVCGKSFHVRSKLKLHATQHSSERPFACDQCDKTFPHKRALKNHSSVHSDLKPHVCSYCNKAFRLKQTLVVHLRLHTGSRPFSCEYCGKGFYNHANLYLHVRTVHGADPRKKKKVNIDAISDEKIM